MIIKMMQSNILEADQEYHMWLNAITYVKKDKDLIRVKEGEQGSHEKGE